MGKLFTHVSLSFGAGQQCWCSAGGKRTTENNGTINNGNNVRLKGEVDVYSSSTLAYIKIKQLK